MFINNRVCLNRKVCVINYLILIQITPTDDILLAVN